jgi:hypothetical protein
MCYRGDEENDNSRRAMDRVRFAGFLLGHFQPQKTPGNVRGGNMTA